MHKAILAAMLTVTVVLAGCADDDSDPEPVVDDGLTDITPVQGRAALPFRTNASEQPWSYVLEDGAFDVLPGIGHTLTIDLPLGSGLPTADVHMGLFFPDNGCDWDSLLGVDPAPEAQMLPFPVGGPETPDACRLPVVSDIGPYYGEPLLGDVHATEPANRLGRFLIENLVPHGYIVAQVSVTGTGDSTGCMDLMGEVEQASVQAATRYLGDAAFSNGAVALTGRSYDGSTPWEAAMAPDLPQLKTVVPISGLYGQLDLMWKNGSAELRGPGVLWGLYYAFTYTGNDPVSTNGDTDAALLQAQQIAENLVCAETQAGGALAAATWLYGGDFDPRESGSYWEERSFDEEVLEHYEGSVYFIHGMQDWNVDPHMAFPFYQQLEAKGLDMKGLFGQWGHQYPDRVSEHPENLRWDWAQDLLEWFDHYLKGTGAQPQLHVEIEDTQNQWRTEATWPPRDIQWDVTTLPAVAARIESEGNLVGQTPIPTLPEPVVTPTQRLVWSLGAAEGDLRIAGLPQWHVEVTPTGPGGQLYAELRDATEDRRITHATMDLRYHAGGMEPQVVVPGLPVTAHMEFFPVDAHVPAGHELELVLQHTGQDYLPGVPPTPVLIEKGDLKLPIIQRDGTSLFTPPGWD